MSVFGAYSRYYDLLYRDKDYLGEANYVRVMIERHCPAAVSILDLGCGTGRHDLLLAGFGYQVTGVDLSEEMLAVARDQQGASGGEARKAAAKENGAALFPEFIQGDIRSVRLNQTFDVVVSLFHVMSYQTKNQDLRAAFTTIREHLKPGGLFVFDCWYGPAVLTERPTVRIKRLEDESIGVTRIAEPKMHPNQNLVDVNYQIFVKDKQTLHVEELRETHTMRYLFVPEVLLLLEDCGLRLDESGEFMSGRSAGFDTWSVVFLGGVAQ